MFQIDSRVAIAALSNNVCTDYLKKYRTSRETIQTHYHHRMLALQRVSNHEGIPGNERADTKANEGAESNQPKVPFTLNRAKIIIEASVTKYPDI